MLIGVTGRAEAHLAEGRGGGSEARMLGGAAEGQQGPRGAEACGVFTARYTTVPHESFTLKFAESEKPEGGSELF